MTWLLASRRWTSFSRRSALASHGFRRLGSVRPRRASARQRHRSRSGRNVVGPLLYVGVSPTPLTAAFLAVLSLGGGRRCAAALPVRRVHIWRRLAATLAVGLLSAPLAARGFVEPLVNSTRIPTVAQGTSAVRTRRSCSARSTPDSWAHVRLLAPRDPLGLRPRGAGFHAAGDTGARVVHAQMLVLLAAFAATLEPSPTASRRAASGCCLCLVVVAPDSRQLLAGYADWSRLLGGGDPALALWLVAGGFERLVLAGVSRPERWR